MDAPRRACQLFQQRRVIAEASTGTVLLEAFLLCLCLIFWGGLGRAGLRVCAREEEEEEEEGVGGLRGV